MSLGIFCAVLFAALLHASWNAIVKLGGDKLLTTILVTGWAAVLSAISVPWLPTPATDSWPWLAASALLQTGYYLLVARAYQHADMSLSYPLMRGCAPLLVAVAGTCLFDEHLSASAWAGIALISGGILCMAGSSRPGKLRLPLAIAVVIATYTLVDAQGARLSGNALSYTLWLFLLSGLPLPLWALFARRQQRLSYPLMRGCAPLLVAVAGTCLFDEHLSASAWAGIALISGGILCMAGSSKPGKLRLPLAIAVVIATYTLVDAQGARLSGNPLSYTLWLFLLSGLPLPLWALFARRQQLRHYLHGNWQRGLVGGVGTTASYAIALWAMTLAPVAVIAALRETSILFALLISALLLKEQVSRRRLLAAGLIVAGVMLLRLA